MVSRYSIAVLPFVNMSSDKENEYFSDGITVDIINALAKIDGLHITARTSSFAFKNQSADVREIGKKLNVAYILEGSIRKAKNTVRISAQLTDTEKGFQVWSDTWDRKLENIFILQDEIAALIAEKVNTDITDTGHPTKQVVGNSDALDAYLRASYLLNTWDFSQAQQMIELFEQAIALDPGFIKAYIGLSHASTWLGSTGHLEISAAQARIDTAIKKALELDPEYSDVYLLIAQKNFWMEWDIERALENIEKALELRPGSTDNLMSKGMYLAAAGQVEEALDNLFQADRLDPYASNIKSGIGMLYGYTNEDAKALEYIEANIKIAPYWDAQYMFKVESLCRLERYKEAMETIGYIAEHRNAALSVAELKAFYYASRNEETSAREQLEIMQRNKRVPVRPGDPDSAFFAQIHLMLGNIDTALGYIESGIEERAAPLLFQRVNSVWDTIRDNPRFMKAVGNIRYPEPGKTYPAFRKKYSRSQLSSAQADKTIEKLNQLMRSEKPWLNPTLTLSDLAESIDIPVQTMSQVLNEFIGKNFYDYVNSYRLDYFLDLYRNPAYKHFKLLSLAYECGFNSKTTFNSFFRKTLKKTPSDYFRTIK